MDEHHFMRLQIKMTYRGVNKGKAGGAIAPPDFVRIEGTALLLAPPVLRSYWRPWTQKGLVYVW